MGAAILTIIKLIVAVLFIPTVYALSAGFVKELPGMGGMESVFLWGGMTYTLLQLFFYSPQGVFQFGQKIFGEIFKAVPLLAAVVPLFVPILPTMILIACYVAVSFFGYASAQPYLIFFAGFTVAMHLILSAHAEFEEDDNALKPHYLFLISLTYAFNLLLIALLLNLNFPKFSFTNMFMSSFDTAKEIYIQVYQQLFVPK